MTSNSSGQIISAYIKAKTWNRDSHGLFDYDSRHVSYKSMKSSSSVNIMRLKNEIHIVNSALHQKEYCDKIASLTINEGMFNISKDKACSTFENSDESLWLVVKNLSINSEESISGYKLKQGDILRLGRLLFRVRSIKIESNHLGENYLNSPFSNLMIDPNENDFERWHKLTHVINGEAPIDSTCRFCLQNDATVTSSPNPLISPCLCSGSVKYIHLHCLKKWIESRVQVKAFANGGQSFCWKNIECELCHKQFPDLFQNEDECIPLVESFGKDSKNYLELEHIPRDQNTKSRSINVVSFDKKQEISVGRGYETELRIGDISVSRTHAFFKLHNGNIYLRDNNSKFGTLVLVKKSLKLPVNKELSVQIGRTCLTISVKKEESRELKKKIHSVEHSFDCGAQESEAPKEKEALSFEKIEFNLPRKPLAVQANLFKKELEKEESTEEKIDAKPKPRSKLKANHKMDLEEFQTTLPKKIKNDSKGPLAFPMAASILQREDKAKAAKNVFFGSEPSSVLGGENVLGLFSRTGSREKDGAKRTNEPPGSLTFFSPNASLKEPDYLVRRFSK